METVFVVYESGCDGIERIIGVYSTRALADGQAERFDASVDEFELDALLPEREPSTGRSFVTPPWLAKQGMEQFSRALANAQAMNRAFYDEPKRGDTVTVRLPKRFAK